MTDVISSGLRYHEVIVDGQDTQNRGSLNHIQYILPQTLKNVIAAKVIEAQIPFTFSPGDSDYLLSLGHVLYFEWAGSNTWNHDATYPGWTNLLKSILNRGFYWENLVQIPNADIQASTDNSGAITAQKLQTYLNMVVLPQLISDSPIPTDIYWYEKNPPMSVLPKALTITVGNEMDAKPEMCFGTPFRVSNVDTYAPYQQRSYVVYNDLTGTFTVTPAGGIANASTWNVIFTLSFTVNNTGLTVPAAKVSGKVGAKNFDSWGWGGGPSGATPVVAVGSNDGFNSATVKNTLASVDRDGVVDADPFGVHCIVWQPWLHLTVPDTSTPLTNVSLKIPSAVGASPGMFAALDQTHATNHLTPAFSTQGTLIKAIQPNGPCYMSGGRIGTASFGSYQGSDLFWRNWNTLSSAPDTLGFDDDSVDDSQWANASLFLGGGLEKAGGLNHPTHREVRVGGVAQVSQKVTSSVSYYDYTWNVGDSSIVTFTTTLPERGKFTTPYYILLRSNLGISMYGKMISSNSNASNVVAYIPLTSGSASGGGYGSLIQFTDPNAYMFFEIGEQDIRELTFYCTLGNEPNNPIDFNGDSFIIRLALLVRQGEMEAQPRVMDMQPSSRPGKRSKSYHNISM